jgi:site-specific DNA-cytosine methylase
VVYVEGEAAAASSLVASMEAGWLHPAPIWSDMRTFDAKPWRGNVHILASGDPCQENSVAGKGAGADGERFLAPEVCRIAAECRPDIVFRENVPGNSDGQIEAIVPALEGLGCRVAAGIFSSSETGNTMRRERLFIMADCDSAGFSLWGNRSRNGAAPHGGGETSRLGYSRDNELARTPSERRGKTGRDSERSEEWTGGTWAASGTIFQPPTIIPGPTDSRWIDVLERFPEYQPALSQEEAQSHLRRGVDAMAHRVERLRATGNGVDPMVAAYAFLSLNALLRETRGR